MGQARSVEGHADRSWKVKMARTNIEWVAQFSILEVGALLSTGVAAQLCPTGPVKS